MMQPRPEARRPVSILAIVLLVVCTLAWNAYAATRPPVYELRVAGQPVGLVGDPTLVHTIAEQVLKAQREKTGYDLVCVTSYEIDKTSKKGKLLEREQISEALASLLEFRIKAAVIQVNNQDIIALASRQEAEAVLDGIRQFYEKGSTSSRASVLELRFNEDIRVEEKIVDPSMIKNPDDARQILLRGTDKMVLHTVKRGQSLWSIARDANISLDSLRKANPELRGDRIDVGQKLNLTVAEPYVTVVSIERQVVTLNIPFRTQTIDDPEMWPWEMKVQKAGAHGKKEVTYEIKRKNGQEVGRDIIKEVHLSDPVTQVVIRGTKIVPDMGTGQLVFPVVGRITSRFGMRSGAFHNGLDIAAPAGTPIHAADSGTVTFAGWRSLYGNMVMIDHGGGKRVTAYGHCSVLLVRAGDKVEKGQVIARVGSTGRSTGSHVHFEVRVDGVPQDPAKYYPGLK